MACERPPFLTSFRDNVSLVAAIKKGEGSDAGAAASAVTRVMIALKKRRHETRLQNDVKSGEQLPRLRRPLLTS